MFNYPFVVGVVIFSSEIVSAPDVGVFASGFGTSIVIFDAGFVFVPTVGVFASTFGLWIVIFAVGVFSAMPQALLSLEEIL